MTTSASFRRCPAPHPTFDIRHSAFVIPQPRLPAILGPLSGRALLPRRPNFRRNKRSAVPACCAALAALEIGASRQQRPTGCVGRCAWDAEATEVQVTLPEILSDDPIVVTDNGGGRKEQDRGKTSTDDLLDAIRDGAVLRVRPKAMTVAVILAGLFPIMWGTGTGSEVMQRIAAPMVGGMITAPLLSMFVIPAAYLLMRRPRDAQAWRWAFWSSRREAA